MVYFFLLASDFVTRGTIFGRLRINTIADLVYRTVRMGKLERNQLAELDEVIKDFDIGFVGSAAAAEFMQQISMFKNSQIHKTLVTHARDGLEVSRVLRAHEYTFNQVVDLTTEALQTICQSVSPFEWALAMLGVGPQVRSQILSKMAEEMQRETLSELKVLQEDGEVAEYEVEKAQKT